MREILNQKLQSVEDALIFAENIIETVRESLIVLDFSLKVVFANKSFYETFKVSPEETIGRFIYDLGNKQWDILKLKELLETILPAKSTFDNYEIEHTFESIGRKVMLLNARRIDHVQLILLEIADITDQKAAENKIILMLKEKEELLKEVHHRIKNNMSIVSGLLMIQAASMKDKSAAEAVKVAENRLNNMSLLYDKLCSSGNFNEISLKEYLDKLIDGIFFVLTSSSHIAVEKNIEDITISARISFSLGIIINELMTNVIKHAFTGKEKGTVKISASRKGKKIVIIVQDDGVGLPKSVNLKNSKGFGLNLVGMMIVQLNGNIDIKYENGTKFIIEFENEPPSF